jgi:soluble lytic murein transglycosylase
VTLPHPRTLLIGFGLGLAAALALLPGFQRVDRADLYEAVQLTRIDPYDSPLLQPYARYRDALDAGDLATIVELSGGDGYLAYRAALTLARNPALAPSERIGHYRRVLTLRVEEPLARAELRDLQLELARVAEAAGDDAAAVSAFREALPEREAVEALARLQTDPYRLANSYLQARRYREALDALGGLTAPSIEAPAHRALGQHGAAIDAFERWLVEVPGSPEALIGRAWSHFSLGDIDTADTLFAQLGSASALYGRALIANRRGDIDRAVTLLRSTGDASDLWLATGMLEARDRYADAVPVYLQLARGGSTYADDAAYRALVLAERLGDGAAATTAESLIPRGSFFDLIRSGTPALPSATALVDAPHPALELATALLFVGEMEAAVGELVFALQDAGSEAEVVAIGEMLQSLGEFRQSQRAAQRYVTRGSSDLRTWQLAYPRAYPELVEREAARNDLDPAWVWAIMRQESAFYPQAVSFSDARGLMQVIPSTWDWLAELQDETPGNPFDHADNIRYGSYYLGYLMDYHGGDPELVVTSYNRGQGYIRRLYESAVVQGDKDEFYREIDALETREYLQRVVVNYRVYKGLYGER